MYTSRTTGSPTGIPQSLALIVMTIQLIGHLPISRRQNHLIFSVKFKQYLHILDNFAFGGAQTVVLVLSLTLILNITLNTLIHISQENCSSIENGYFVKRYVDNFN